MKSKVGIPGSVALVSGAGSGIGRATAAALARRGAKMVLAVDINEVTAKVTADSCRDQGVGATAYCCDMSDGESVMRLAEKVEAEHGPLDILVNNAGVGMSGRFMDMSLDDWEWIRSINLDGVVNGCSAFGPAMVARGRGHVVNMSSGLAYLPNANTAAYSTTKAAVLTFSRSLRADWSGMGVGVSAVCPGVINTPILESARFLGEFGDPRAVSLAKRGFRFGHSPEVVARAVVNAIDKNKAIANAGIEARVGWHLARITPVAIVDLVGRPAPTSLLGLRSPK